MVPVKGKKKVFFVGLKGKSLAILPLGIPPASGMEGPGIPYTITAEQASMQSAVGNGSTAVTWRQC
jgi:hypothetical protein